MKRTVILLFAGIVLNCGFNGAGGNPNQGLEDHFTIEFSDEFEFENNNKSWSFNENWRRAAWLQNHTTMGIDRAYPEDGLMKFFVEAGSPYLGGSIQSKYTYGYGRWEARLKPSNVAGVVNAFFAMNLNGSDIDGIIKEVDIEFTPYTFSEDGGEVHIALHAQGASNLIVEDISLDFNPSSDFHIWSFEILPDRIRWAVDGVQLYEYEYNGNHYMDMTNGYQLLLNAWTNDDHWVQGPPDERAEMQVDWVKFYTYSVQ